MRAKRGGIIALVPESPPAPPPNRGRMMSPDEVAREKFGGHVSPQWVRRNVRPLIRLGHRTVVFFEMDVEAWIEAHRTK